MDPGKKELLSEDTSENKKSCSDCNTTKTPLWRSGPDGPKSLCNACGIKYRKRKISMGVYKGAEKKKKRANTTPATTTTTASATNSSVTGACVAATPTTPTTNSPPATGACVVRGLSESLKMGLMAFGKEVLLQRQRSSTVKRQKRRTMGEEEQAAVLLMALSCGSVFA